MAKRIETNDDVLDIVYRISPDINYEVNDGIVTILIKQDHIIQRFFRKLRVKIPDVKKMELDEKSSFVFNQIDGKRSVREIGELVDNHFNEGDEFIYEALLTFLNHIEINEHYIEKVD